MPYKSRAQAAYFNMHKAELEKQGVNVDEWNAASKGKKLPKKVKKYALGGRPTVGKPAVVGERGPELFVPDRPGKVVPNKAKKSKAPKNAILVHTREVIHKPFPVPVRKRVPVPVPVPVGGPLPQRRPRGAIPGRMAGPRPPGVVAGPPQIPPAMRAGPRPVVPVRPQGPIAPVRPPRPMGMRPSPFLRFSGRPGAHRFGSR